MPEKLEKLSQSDQEKIRRWIDKRGLDKCPRCGAMNDYKLEFILTTSSDLKEDTLFAIVCPTCDSNGDFSSDLDRFHRLGNVDIGPERGFRPHEATIKDIENRQAKLRIAEENNELLKEINGLLKEIRNATKADRLVIAVSDDKVRFKIKRENEEDK